MSHKIEEGYAIKFNNGMYCKFDFEQHSDGYDFTIYLEDKIDDAELIDEEESVMKLIKNEMDYENLIGYHQESGKHIEIKIDSIVRYKRVTVVDTEILEEIKI